MPEKDGVRGGGGEGGQVHVHVAGLCHKAEDAAVLLVKRYVHGSSAIRFGELAGERILRDLREIAEAILNQKNDNDTNPHRSINPTPRAPRAAAAVVGGTHKKSVLSVTPRPNTAR